MWAVGGLSGAARWLEFVAIAIFAYELTRSPALVALLSVLRMAPYVMLGMVVGGVADLVDRRRLLMASTALMGVVAVAMAVLTAIGAAGYGAAALATMASGAFWTVDMPVRRELLVAACGRDRMAAGLGLDNATMYTTRAIGPLLGGVTYQLLGMPGIFTLIAAAYACCFVLTGRYATSPERSADAVPDGDRSPRRLVAALLPPRALIGDRRFQVLMGVTLVYNLWCFPFITMVPVIAQQDFGFAPFLVGALSACDGIGGTIGALTVGAIMTERTMFRFHYLGTAAFLVLVAVMTMMLQPLPSAVLLLAMGGAAACFSATQFALVYLNAPSQMRGRATGVLSLFIGSSMLGHYHTGILFERLGSIGAMRLMAAEGLVALALLGIVWLRLPAHADRRHQA